MKKIKTALARSAALAAFALLAPAAADAVADAPTEIRPYDTYTDTEPARGYAPGGVTNRGSYSGPCYTRYDYPRPGYGGNSDAHLSAGIESDGTISVPATCAGDYGISRTGNGAIR